MLGFDLASSWRIFSLYVFAPVLFSFLRSQTKHLKHAKTYKVSSCNYTYRASLEEQQQIISQLEQDRFVASKRAHRLEDEVKDKEKVRTTDHTITIWG